MNTTTQKRVTGSDETESGTIEEFAASWGVDYQTARGLIEFLKNSGAAKAVGTEAKPEGTRGKRKIIYEIPLKVVLQLGR